MSIELPARLASIVDQAIVPKAAQIKQNSVAAAFLVQHISCMPRRHSCVLQALAAPQQVHE
jgi:hypothetical protein